MKENTILDLTGVKAELTSKREDFTHYRVKSLLERSKLPSIFKQDESKIDNLNSTVIQRVDMGTSAY